MEERTGLSQNEISATLASLDHQGLVIAPSATSDTGAHLGQAWISPEGVAVVQSMIVEPDPVPVRIMGFGDEAVSALQQLVVLAKRSQVEARDIAVLEERIAALEAASDDEDRLQQAADVASVIAGSESLMRLFIVMVFPLLGRAFGG